MLNLPIQRPGRLALGVAVAAAALTLAACGGSNNHNGGDSATPAVGDNPLPVVTADTFIAIVKSRIAVTNDTTEPASLDGITATKPETTAPEPTT